MNICFKNTKIRIIFLKTGINTGTEGRLIKQMY